MVDTLANGVRLTAAGSGLFAVGLIMTVAPAVQGADVDARSNVTARASATLDLGARTTFAGKFRPGMRTSDFLAAEWWCAVDPSFQDHCTVEDQHRSTPKNIGNILCLPMGQDSYHVEESCQRLLDAGSDQNCQRNSNSGNRETCPGAPVIRPHCNYRTEATGEVSWRWTVTEADGELVIGCSQEGYTGFTPGDLAGNEDGGRLTGCLRAGRLRALSLEDNPLRPCRPGESEITIPAAEAD